MLRRRHRRWESREMLLEHEQHERTPSFASDSEHSPSGPRRRQRRWESNGMLLEYEQHERTPSFASDSEHSPSGPRRRQRRWESNGMLLEHEQHERTPSFASDSEHSPSGPRRRQRRWESNGMLLEHEQHERTPSFASDSEHSPSGPRRRQRRWESNGMLLEHEQHERTPSFASDSEHSPSGPRRRQRRWESNGMLLEHEQHERTPSFVSDSEHSPSGPRRRQRRWESREMLLVGEHYQRTPFISDSEYSPSDPRRRQRRWESREMLLVGEQYQRTPSFVSDSEHSPSGPRRRHRRWESREMLLVGEQYQRTPSFVSDSEHSPSGPRRRHRRWESREMLLEHEQHERTPSFVSNNENSPRRRQRRLESREMLLVGEHYQRTLSFVSDSRHLPSDRRRRQRRWESNETLLVGEQYQRTPSFVSGSEHSPNDPVMQTSEMRGSYRPPLATPMPVMETNRPSMGPTEPNMSSSVKHLGPSRQHMGPSGPGLGPTGPNTGSLGLRGSQMGIPGLPPIPQHVKESPQNVNIVTQAELEIAQNKAQAPTKTEMNMATEASQAQTSVQENAVKDVKTDGEVSSNESEEEVVEEKKKQTEVIEKNKPESKAEQNPELEAEQKSESKAEQKPVTKTKPVFSTPIPGTVWRVVQTNDGKHFFYNPTKRQSVWKMPEELKNRPDVEKLLLPKQEIKIEIKEEKDLQEEPPSKKIKLEVEVKEEKEESSSEATQEIVLEKENTNTVKVQTTENMPVVSLEDRKKQFKELLAEKNVSISSTWERELHKVIFDKRYTLLTSRECKQVFEDYMKERAEKECQKRLHVKENSELYRPSLEESNLIVKLEAEVKEEKEESSSEANQEIVLDEETTNAVKVLTAENMPVVSLEDRKKKFKALLAENDVSPPSTRWKELYKIVFDNSSTILSIQERKQAFGEYLKESVEKERKKRHRYVNEFSELYRQLLEDSNLNVKLEAEDKETTKAVKVQTAENMPVVSLEDKQKQFKELLAEKNVSTPPQARTMTLAEILKNRAEKERMKRYGQIKGNAELFRQLLEESNLNAKSTFYSFVTAHSHDKRFGMVKLFPDKKYLFQDYKREFSQREEELKSAPIREKVKNYFFKMLSETPDIDHYTSWRDVRSQLYLDPRYKAAGLDSRRESWFCTYLRIQNIVKGDFIKMLGEIPDIKPSTRWDDLKSKVSSDPRNKAVSDDTHREEWFKAYLKIVNSVTSKKVMQKKEVQEKQLLLSSLKKENPSCLDHRDAAFEDFKQFLVETVKDTKDRMFNAFEARFCKSPIWTIELTKKEKRKLYSNHVTAIHKKNLEILRSILDEMDLPLKAGWREVKKRVQADPRFFDYTDSGEQLIFDYAQCMYEKNFKPEENCSSQSLSPQKTGQEIYSSW